MEAITQATPGCRFFIVYQFSDKTITQGLYLYDSIEMAKNQYAFGVWQPKGTKAATQNNQDHGNKS